MNTTLPLPYDHLASFCQRRAIRRLRVFGSILRPDFRTDSDVDMLAEFEPGARITYFDLVDMQDELAALLGRPVDLGTPQSLTPYIRDRVIATAQVVYERR